MKPILIDNIGFDPDIDSIAKKLHISQDADEYIELKDLLDEVKKAARPKAVYKPVFIEETGEDYVILDSQKMQSKVMPQNLKNVNRVFAYVATCGKEIEDYAKTVTDYLHSWWMNSIMEFVLGDAINALRARVKSDFELGKLATMSPGSLPDWPINEQKKLFCLIGDVEEIIGVTLTDSMLMVPAKTVSGFYFETDTNYVNCQLCTRVDCPNRRQPFDEQKYKTVHDC